MTVTLEVIRDHQNVQEIKILLQYKVMRKTIGQSYKNMIFKSR